MASAKTPTPLRSRPRRSKTSDAETLLAQAANDPLPPATRLDTIRNEQQQRANTLRGELADLADRETMIEMRYKQAIEAVRAQIDDATAALALITNGIGEPEKQAEAA